MSDIETARMRVGELWVKVLEANNRAIRHADYAEYHAAQGNHTLARILTTLSFAAADAQTAAFERLRKWERLLEELEQ